MPGELTAESESLCHFQDLRFTVGKSGRKEVGCFALPSQNSMAAALQAGGKIGRQKGPKPRYRRGIRFRTHLLAGWVESVPNVFIPGIARLSAHEHPIAATLDCIQRIDTRI